MTHIRKGFTLIEMLIVIVIIGILAATIIPRVMGIQARARDTARESDLRSTSAALETYKIDSGSYPVAVYAFQKINSNDVFSFPQALAQTAEPGSSLSTLGGVVKPYLKTIPLDPDGLGLQAASSGSCTSAGETYAYNSDASGSRYALIATKESKKGNTDYCDNTIERANDGSYQKVGAGLQRVLSDYPPASEWTSESCFTFDSSTQTIKAYDVSCGGLDVVIPATIQGVEVTTIGMYVFRDLGLTSVFIPDTVISLGYFAFTNNNLTTITLPPNLTSIGNSCFLDNNITSVVIPSSLTTLNIYIFKNNNLTSVSIPEGVTEIRSYAFQNNNLTTFTIPSTLMNFAMNAFLGNGPSKESRNPQDFIPGTEQTWILQGRNRVKQ